MIQGGKNKTGTSRDLHAPGGHSVGQDAGAQEGNLSDLQVESLGQPSEDQGMHVCMIELADPRETAI